MVDLFSVYTQSQTQGQLEKDPAQAEIISRCYALQQQIIDWEKEQQPSIRTWVRSWYHSPSPPKGLYIYGDVGRGKSMIMDMFFDTTPIFKKRRVHFHAFMQEIQMQLHQWRKEHPYGQDPLPHLAKQFSRDIHLLCFDEFHVQDIADAMILGRLFDALWACDVIIVATSNVAPQDLYKDGLQRENFLPFITSLEHHLNICHLVSPHDYRLRHLSHLGSVYFTPLNRESNQHIYQSFSTLTKGATPYSSTLVILGRSLTLTHTHGDIALVDFTFLCGQALGAADYLEIAHTFHTLILTNIPLFTPDKLNEAKRFITLIDTLYDHRIKLICSAESIPASLCQHPKLAFEFQRTASRLTEMQSEAYWALPKV